MGLFVIRRIDSGGGWVARPGSAQSYTPRLSEAARYHTRQAAELNRCPDNEIVTTLEEAAGVRMCR